MVWNPYLGQTRCIQIQPVNNYYRLESSDKYAFGYDNKNHNHKILRFLDINRHRWQLGCTDPLCPAPPRYTVNAGLGGTCPRGMRFLEVLSNPDPRLAQALAVQARGTLIFRCATDDPPLVFYLFTVLRRRAMAAIYATDLSFKAVTRF
ncbi:hypothetical protein DY000_02049769 [Brassica cretica]|uniref:F-box associated beta-propeller type 1 domain-containing protein n=1 Tax=Brassica cretica TaxID=69181 RepID=A0ABQ7EWJ8_BRACR|nr:hypothetical protein DY000_02049769 [Brassica cretica]